MSFGTSIQLASGRAIETRRYLVSDSTHGTWFESPSASENRRLIAAAEEDGRKQFGNHSIIVIPPNITIDRENRPFLPPVRFVAEFHSGPIDESIGYGSAAIVIWYQRRDYPIVGDDVRDRFLSMDWDAGASDLYHMI